MKKFKVTEIAKKLGITHSSVCQWFAGSTQPTIDKALRLEDEFGIPVHAWRDIKAYLSTAQSMPVSNNDSHYKEECPCT